MNVERLHELLGAFAAENPHRELSSVTVIEFAAWLELRKKWERLEESAARWRALGEVTP